MLDGSTRVQVGLKGIKVGHPTPVRSAVFLEPPAPTNGVLVPIQGTIRVSVRVIVFVISSEHASAKMVKVTIHGSNSGSETYSVVISLACHPEAWEILVDRDVIGWPEGDSHGINQKFLVCYFMHVFQSQPEISILHISKSVFIIVPCSVEVLVHFGSSLQDSPTIVFRIRQFAVDFCGIFCLH